MEKFWKLPWNPQGYDYSTISVSTKSKAMGDILKLEHSYFLGDSVTATLGNKVLTVSGTDPNADILLSGKELYLSKVSSADVYSQIKINSIRVCNTDITVQCKYICDTMNPDDFGQELNYDSDVQHNSLVLLVLGSNDIYTKNIRVEESIEFPNAEITTDHVMFNQPEMSVQGVHFTQEDITVPNEIHIKGTDSALRYEKGLNRWLVYNKGTQVWDSLVKLAGKQDSYGIPIANAEDLSGLRYVPWLRVDEENHGVVTEYISAKTINFNGIKMTSDDDGVHIGALTICPDGMVKIGSMLFDAEKLMAMETMLDDIKELKARS